MNSFNCSRLYSVKKYSFEFPNCEQIFFDLQCLHNLIFTHINLTIIN